MHSTTPLYRFSALSLVGQALRLSQANARLYFVWSLPALLFALAQAACWGNSQVDSKVFHFDITWAYAIGFIQLSQLFFAPLGRSVCRLVCLGEMPDRSVPAQLFMAPTWRYIVRNLLANIQCILLAMVFGSGLALLSSLMFGSPWEARGASSASMFMRNMLFPVAQALAHALLISRMTLVRPAAAVGRTITLKKLGRLGAPSRWCMIKAIVALWGPLWVINSVAMLVATHFVIAGPWLMAWNVLETAVAVLLGVVELVVCALIYDRVVAARHEEIEKTREKRVVFVHEAGSGAVDAPERAV